MKNFICPSCGGKVEFNPNLQKMKCPYCDTLYEMDAVNELCEALDEEQVKSDSFSWENEEAKKWDEANGLKTYLCNTCSGEIITDDTTAATACPYCGNPVVLTDRLQGLLKPDFVIPFRTDKKQAVENYKKHITGKRLLPDIFKDKNHIDEIKGIYVPFFLYDADISSDAQYKATRVRHWSDNNYNYTETSHYSVFRGGDMAFSKIPVDGSLKMADELMESIEPFDFSDAVDFSTAYLSGFFADKYDVCPDECIIRANERIKNTAALALEETIHGYSSVVTKNINVNMNSGSSKYALYPVWLLNTTFEGEKYTFAMNGQTGKFVGNLPADKKKVNKFFALSAVGGTVAGIIISILYNLFLA